jgi:hypothetical protein
MNGYEPENHVNPEDRCDCQKHSVYIGKMKIQTTYITEEVLCGHMRGVERCKDCKRVVDFERIPVEYMS